MHLPPCLPFCTHPRQTPWSQNIHMHNSSIQTTNQATPTLRHASARKCTLTFARNAANVLASLQTAAAELSNTVGQPKYNQKSKLVEGVIEFTTRAGQLFEMFSTSQHLLLSFPDKLDNAIDTTITYKDIACAVTVTVTLMLLLVMIIRLLLLPQRATRLKYYLQVAAAPLLCWALWLAAGAYYAAGMIASVSRKCVITAW